MSRRLARVALLTLCAGLVACTGGDSADAMLERYRERLANAVDMAAPSPAAQQLAPLRYPPRRQLTRPQQKVSLNLLDFLRLSDCDLQRLLGQRNSTLGRVMAPTQQLIYQRRFLQLGEACLQVLSADPERAQLRADLARALQIRRAESDILAWNAGAASEEFQRLLSLAGGPLAPAQAQQRPGEMLSALTQLRELLHSDALLSSPRLEAHYQLIAGSNRGGQLLRSQLRLSVELEALSGALRRHLQLRPLCFRPRPTPRARVAQTVFLRFYIGEVQPYIAAVHQQSAALRQALWQLLAPYRPWPPAFEAYWQANWSEQGEAATWARFQRAVQEHTRVWQDLLGACGLAPGGAVAE